MAGLGTIRCTGGTKASFAFAVASKGESVSGAIAYSDPASHVAIFSVRITSLEVAGSTAKFTGNCGGSCTFSVTVVDGGTRPEDDTFAITRGSYSAGPAPLSSGNILVRAH